MKKTFWEIQREKKRAITLLFLFFFPFFTFSLAVLFEILRFSSVSLFFKDAKFSEFLIVSSVISLIVFFISVKGSSEVKIYRYLEMLNAQVPDLKDMKHQQVANVVREMAIAAAVPKPRVYVIPVLGKNAFSAFNIIAITEGAVSALDRDELQAVVAHEMAHYLRGDSYYKGVLSSFAMTITFFLTISLFFAGGDENSERRGFGGGFIGIAVVAYIFLVELFTKFLNALISRRMEDLADAMAVQFTRNPLSLASALFKVSRDRVRGISLLTNPAVAPLFIVNPARKQIDESSGVFGDIFATHPPINKRINTLLKLAGVSRKELVERTSPVRNNREWWVEKQDENLGPFTLEELLEKTWIGEGVKIRGKEGEVKLSQILSKFRPIEGQCPRCGGPLFNTYYDFVPIIKCGRCGGILVREDRIMRILARGENQITEAEEKVSESSLEKERKTFYIHGASPEAVDASQPLKCPFCGGEMWRKFFNFINYVPVDYCPKCKYYFFDSGEIEMIIAGVKRTKYLYR